MRTIRVGDQLLKNFRIPRSFEGHSRSFEGHFSAFEGYVEAIAINRPSEQFNVLISLKDSLNLLLSGYVIVFAKKSKISPIF